MEDILASIRRIIADDQDGPRPAALAPPDAPEPQDPLRADEGAADEEILDLAEIAEPAPAFHAADDHFAPSHVDLDAFARALPEPEGEPFDRDGDPDDGPAAPAHAEGTHPLSARSDHAEAAAATAQFFHPEPASAPAAQAQPTRVHPAQPQASHPQASHPQASHPQASHPQASQPQAAESYAAPQPRVKPDPVQQPTGRATAGAQSGDDRLISAMTDSAVSQAFNMLAHTVFSQNAMTLEDLVKDMLRPLLKDWLDDNLPTLVERLVRAEIERVARGGSRR